MNLSYSSFLMPFYLNFKVRIWFILLVNIGYYLIKLLNSYLKKIWEVPAWSVRFNNFFPYMDFKYLNYLVCYHTLGTKKYPS